MNYLKNAKQLLIAGVITIFMTAAANATLELRLGGKAIYDTNRNITWLADPSVASFNAFDNGSSNSDGLVTYSNAVGWLANLEVFGVTGWNTTNESNRYYNPGDRTEVDYLIDELLLAPSVFYDAFGFKSYWAVDELLVCGGHACPVPGFTGTPLAIGFFLDITAPRIGLGYDNGFLQLPARENGVLAKHDGDVFAQISEPMTVVLLGIGLIGLATQRRKV